MSDYILWRNYIFEIAVRDGWGIPDAEAIATTLEGLFDLGITPEEAYRKYTEGEV